jgi:hypothetical protein
LTMAPPPRVSKSSEIAELPEKVLLVTVTRLVPKIAPACMAVLSEKVLLVMVMLALPVAMAPARACGESVALLPEKVLLVIVTVPSLL